MPENLTDPRILVYLADRSVRSAAGKVAMARRWSDRNPVTPEEMEVLESRLTAARARLAAAKTLLLA